jgi:hypothetical protein
VSPVSGTTTPVEPVEAPAGSGASQATLEATPEVESSDAEQPATTTPSQTVNPSAEPGGPGTATGEESGEVEATTRENGGDAGTTPTPRVDAVTEDAAPVPETGEADGEKEDGEAEGKPEGAVETVQPPSKHSAEDEESSEA